MSIELARQELKKLSIKEQERLLEILEAQRRKEKFILYLQPQDQQLDAIRAFTFDVKTMVITGGNRAGKSLSGAAIAVAWCLGKEYFKDEVAWEWVKDLPIPPPPNNIWIVGLDFPTLRDVLWSEKLLVGRNHPPLIPKEELDRPPNNTDWQIFFRNGSKITGKSADSGREKFQGASVDLIWIDEEPEADIYDECFQRTADCAGKILVTLTPLVDIASGIRQPWVFDLHTDMVKGRKDVKFAKLSVLSNPYVPEDEKVRLQVKWAGHPEEAARLFGDFVQRSGLVYNLWNPNKHLIRPFPIPRDWTRVVSIDPANTGITAAIWCAIEPGTNNMYLYREYYEKNLTISEHAKNIYTRCRGEAIDYWIIDPKWGSQRDGSNHKSGQQLYREQGLPVRLAEVDKDYGLQVSKEYVQATLDLTSRHPKLFVFDDLFKFTYEVQHYTWAVFGRGEMKGLSKEKPLKRDDHGLNAWQYACSMRFKGRRATKIQNDTERTRSAELNSYFQS